MANNAVGYARRALLTRKSEVLLLAAHGGRLMSRKQRSSFLDI